MLINIHTHCIRNEGIEIINSYHDGADFYSYGIAPFEIDNKSINETYLLSDKCKFIGEIGLDKSIQKPIKEQIEIFKTQLNYSEKLKKPVIIHCVKAYNEIIEIKKNLKPTQPWIIHGFRKTNLTQTLLNNDFYLSIGTAILFDNKLKESLKTIPLSRLFLETDNDNYNSIEEVYKVVAELKGISLLNLQASIYQNFINLFNHDKLA
jgi:TatD DNase family protein